MARKRVGGRNFGSDIGFRFCFERSANPVTTDRYPTEHSDYGGDRVWSTCWMGLAMLSGPNRADTNKDPEDRTSLTI